MSAHSRRRRLVPAAAATAITVAVCAALGTWQVQRLHWKHRLIATVTARAEAAPLTAPGRDDPRLGDGEALDYLHVTIAGRFLAGHDAHVQALLGEPRGRFGGPGLWILTPLVRDDGAIVWINRGFVPIDRLAEASPAPSGAVRLTGLVRRPEPRGAFTPADDAGKNLWFVRDPARLSAAFGLEAAATLPYTIDAAASPAAAGLPQAGETRLAFPDNHLGYALTWYGLALAAAGVFVVRLRSELRKPASPAGAH
jgi:surfeit locus 1 family protein